MVLPEFIAQMKNPDNTLYAIAAQYGVSYTTVFNIAKKHDLMCGRIPGGTARTVKAHVLDRIKDLTLQGKSVGEIAKELNLGKACISSKRKLLGLAKTYNRKADYKRDYNNADEKAVPCSRIALIRASNFATTQGKSLKDIVDAAINQYIDSQTV
jgi:hypothetical protein